MMTATGRLRNTTSGRKRHFGIVATVMSGALLWGALGGGSTAMAFDQPWFLNGCTPAVGDHGLWDDAPGVGPGNEAAFFWVSNGVNANEGCGWRSPGVGVASNMFPNLGVRVAVNDSARFTVRVFDNGGALLTSVTAFGGQAHSGFISLPANIPAGAMIGTVVINLEDSPDNLVGSSRSSALIDEIRIWNAGSGAVGWRERFNRAA